MVAGQLLLLTVCLTYISLARCVQECDNDLQKDNYFDHMTTSDTHTLHNISLSLRKAEGSTDQLGDFNGARVCHWHYEMDFNSSRFPQVMYTARCDEATWCDNTNGMTYECQPLNQYRVPVVLGTECNLFRNTEWTLDFVNIAMSCYPSQVEAISNTICLPLER